MRFGKPDDGRRRERTPSPKKPPRPGAVRERVLILVLTLVLMLLYFSVQRLADDGTLPRALGIAVMVLYMVSFWHYAHNACRLWLLLLLIPFVFVFLAEAMYLFLWLDNIENWFK